MNVQSLLHLVVHKILTEVHRCHGRSVKEHPVIEGVLHFGDALRDANRSIEVVNEVKLLFCRDEAFEAILLILSYVEEACDVCAIGIVLKIL